MKDQGDCIVGMLGKLAESNLKPLKTGKCIMKITKVKEWKPNLNGRFDTVSIDNYLHEDLEIHGMSFSVTFDLDRGEKAKTNGKPEDCNPGTDNEFKIISVFFTPKKIENELEISGFELPEEMVEHFREDIEAELDKLYPVKEWR